MVPTLSTYISPKRRVVLIGDAAHAIPPTGGQGAAQAFEDAQTLAYALARCAAPTQPRTTPQLHEDILSKWSWHRQARIAQVLAFTTRGGDIRKRVPSTVERLVKEWGMWA